MNVRKCFFPVSSWTIPCTKGLTLVSGHGRCSVVLLFHNAYVSDVSISIAETLYSFLHFPSLFSCTAFYFYLFLSFLKITTTIQSKVQGQSWRLISYFILFLSVMSYCPRNRNLKSDDTQNKTSNWCNLSSVTFSEQISWNGIQSFASPQWNTWMFAAGSHVRRIVTPRMSVWYRIEQMHCYPNRM
jgi:hypothetical protein